MTALTRFELARPVTREGFNLDHPSPQVAQEQRAKRPGEALRKIHYSHIVERYSHGSWSISSPLPRLCRRRAVRPLARLRRRKAVRPFPEGEGEGEGLFSGAAPELVRYITNPCERHCTR